MSRTLSAEMQTALQAQVIRPVYFAEIEFSSTTLRFSSLSYDIAWNAHTWLGNGLLLHPGATSETIDQNANDIAIVLDGHDTDLLALVLEDLNQSNTVSVYLGLFDESFALIASPTQIFYGEFDSATIKDSGQDKIIEMHYENELLSQRNIVERRYTHYSQQAYFSGDAGFIYASQAAAWDGWWGTVEKIKFIKKRKTQQRN